MEVTCLDCETNFTFIVDRVATGSFRIRIRVESDSDCDTNPDPLSKSDGVDSAESSSESSNSMGGVAGFAFCRFGGLEAGGGSANRFGYWGGGAGYC